MTTAATHPLENARLAAARKRTGAHETEIEITPAMLDVGVDVLVAHYDVVGGLVDRAIVTEIFKAMMAKRVSRRGPRT